MDIDRIDLRFRLGQAPPRLSALARARLIALGVSAAEPAGPEPGVVAEIDPRLIVDVPALRAAASRAVGARRTTTHPGRALDGSLAGIAVTLVPRDATTRGHAEEALGSWLPEPDPCRFPAGPPRAAIYGMFREMTGYVAVGRNLVIGLAARGVPLAARMGGWKEMKSAGLPPGEDALLDAAFAQPADRSLPSVLLRPAGDGNGTPSLSEFAATRLTGLTCSYTMFECDSIPGRWVRTLREFDQVWVPSTFNQATFAQAGVPSELLRVVPIGIDTPSFAPDGPVLALPNRRRFAFLSVFDWNERKGPDVLLRAWAQAFGPDDDVVLYLRTGRSTVGARGGPDDEIRALGLDPASLAPIEVLSDPLPADAYAALFRSVDAFVLTSRGEAFCIPMLEAMACGVPAIGTGYGGSTDFLDETTGFPIPARLVPVARNLADRIPFYAGQRWADPSIEATATALRRVVDDPAEAQRRAAHGFARAHGAFDRRITARVAERALAEPPPARTIHTAGRSLLVGSLLSTTRTGQASRALFDALDQTGATPRATRFGPTDADLDPVQARRLRRAQWIEPHPAEATFVVDAVARNARAVFLTTVPEDLAAFAEVPTIWTDDAGVARELLARGIARERLRIVRLPVDVSLWTPDAHGTAAGPRTICIAPEPRRVEALTAFARLVGPADDVLLLLAPLRGRPVGSDQLGVELGAAMDGAGVARWNPRIVATASPLTSRLSIPALATSTLVLAADPDWPEHELLRACGVPVVGIDDLDRARLLLTDVAARDGEGVRTRRAAVARARADSAALRTAFDECALLAPIDRRVRPLRIAVVPAASVADPARVVAGLRAQALHEIVGTEGDLRGLDYVVRIEDAVEATFGWDEVLINALEAHGVAVAESSDFQTLFHDRVELDFDELSTGSLLAHNCESGTRIATASGALQLVRAVDATATGPVWRTLPCVVRRLAAAVPA
jgi:hypothetical protein